MNHKGVAHSSVVPTGLSSVLAYYAECVSTRGAAQKRFLKLPLTLKHDFCFKVIIAMCIFKMPAQTNADTRREARGGLRALETRCNTVGGW